MIEFLDSLLHTALATGPLALLAFLALGMFLNSSIMMPPSEHLCIFAGIYGAARSSLYVAFIVLILGLANFLGTLIWYELGLRRARAGHPFLADWLVRWFPRFLYCLYVQQLPRILDGFSQKRDWPVFGLRLVPVIRSIVSYPAGYAQMPNWKFSSLSFAGMLVWVGFWTAIGLGVGKLAYALSLPIGLTFATVTIIVYWIGRSRQSNG